MQTKTEAVAELLALRESAALELAAMPAHKEGSQWAVDRYREIAWINRELARLGVDPKAA